MQPDALKKAAETIASLQARQQQLDHLPADQQPKSLAEAHAIQEAAIAILGQPVAGWKMSVTPDKQVMRGAILKPKVWPSPARVPVAIAPLLGVEAEIAFRLEEDLPPRAASYAREEIAKAFTAIAAIEIVDSRFRSYQDAPPLDRTADFMSNGGFVQGPERRDWLGLDLVNLAIVLLVDGKPLVETKGGHGAGDPFIPALALVNDLQATRGFKAGDIFTTGTYTGLNFVKPGQKVSATFAGFGTVEVTFDH